MAHSKTKRPPRFDTGRHRILSAWKNPNRGARSFDVKSVSAGNIPYFIKKAALFVELNIQLYAEFFHRIQHGLIRIAVIMRVANVWIAADFLDQI